MNTQNKRKFSWRTMIVLTWIMSILSVTLVFTSTTANAANSYDFEVKGATTDFYVNDFAGLFTDQQKADMMEKAVALDKDYGGIQVVVTTVDSLADCTTDGKAHDIYETSYAMYKQYGIGEDDMGILILFSSGDREVWMQTGYKMQTYITDSKSGQLLDNYGMDYFVNDQFAEGLVSLQEGTISEIKSVVPQDWNAPAPTVKQEQKTENAGASNSAKPNNDSSKKGGLGAGIYAIFAAFIAMIAGLFASIKGLFTSKSKATAQKEKADKDLKEQQQMYEDRINSIKQSYSDHERQAISQRDESHQSTLTQLRRSHDSKVSEMQRSINLKDTSIKNLEQEIAKLNTELTQTSRALAESQNKYERIKALHPDTDFDAEVQQMIENEFKASAIEVDQKIASRADMPANKDSIDVFSEAIRIYDKTVPDVQKYMKTDINKLRSLYGESVSLKREFERAEQEKRDRAAAQSAFEKIGAICLGITIGNYQNYETLNKAYRMYMNLSSAEKSYFPDMNLIRSVESLRRTAESDLSNYNAARDAEKEVRSVVDRIYNADEDDRDKLERAMRYYRNLSSSQQHYFSDELLRKLKRLQDEAEEDHRRKEEARRRRKREEEERRRREEEERRRRRQREEEERRRRSSMSSSSFSSSSHHSSFGGHGGRPSGGGAGRHF